MKLIKRSKEYNVKVRAGIMTAFGCAYKGKIEEEKLLQKTLPAGCDTYQKINQELPELYERYRS